jgi:hypothetical protein
MPDDFTTVRLEKAGRTVEFTFHNTIEKPCLKLKIDELRLKFPFSIFSNPPDS